MENFRTETMRDAVDREQEIIRLKGEESRLCDLIAEVRGQLCAANLLIIKQKSKAKAWDDLEEIMNKNYRIGFDKQGEITTAYLLSSLDVNHEYTGSSLTEAVSNALESIKGES